MLLWHRWGFRLSCRGLWRQWPKLPHTCFVLHVRAFVRLSAGDLFRRPRANVPRLCRTHLDHFVVSSVRSRTVVLNIARDGVMRPVDLTIGIHRDLQRGNQAIGLVTFLTRTPSPLKPRQLQQESRVLGIQCMHDVLRVPKSEEGLKII